MEMKGENSELVQPHPGQGDTNLRLMDILRPGEGGSEMVPRWLTEFFQGLDNELLETVSLVLSPCSPSNLQEPFQFCKHPDNGN